jgi:hypothetical protein
MKALRLGIFLGLLIEIARKLIKGKRPSDMSTMSLVGGRLIAGDSLATLSVGLYGLLRTVL